MALSWCDGFLAITVKYKIQKRQKHTHKHKVEAHRKKPLHSLDWHGDVLITHNIYLSIVLSLFSVLAAVAIADHLTRISYQSGHT